MIKKVLKMQNDDIIFQVRIDKRNQSFELVKVPLKNQFAEDELNYTWKLMLKN